MRPSRRAAAVAALTLVAGLSLLASLGGQEVDARLGGLVAVVPGGDFTGHLLLMGACSFFTVRAFGSVRWRGRPLGAARIVIALLLVSLLDEGAQHWLAARTCSWSDALANTLGIVTFGGLAKARLRSAR
ncbi:MAG: VanZ family protein [Acidobacteriota bacterium]